MRSAQRFALIGCGFIGQVHAANLARHPGVELALVCDIDAARAAALAEQFGARAASVPQALSSKAIDAVLIASATPTHAPLLEQAVLAGKAVYCEKPIDLSLSRAREVVASISPLQVPVTVGFNRRFDRSHAQLKAQLQQGVIGRSELIQMVCRASELPPLSYLQASGGQMRDQAIHFFDLLRWLTEDEVVTVGALGAALAMPAIRDIDVDTSVLIMRLQQGALAQLDNARRTAYGYDERISVMGSLGMLASESQAVRGATLYQGQHIRQPGLYADWFSRVQETYYSHLDAFVRHLGGEKVAGLPGLIDGLRAQAIAEAAQLSLTRGEFVEVEWVTV
ncbi:Gfo/Idh/MocA family oxidoreductase [Pantoea dispersa]|jgi:myo-inositol 2-dehydrogenase / D-chiro-inositol 1-dehydrogenase|uniref:Oxidoreductase n=1 Tax=Pantoea dispersa TaxID=59814 RepID=A0ABY2ZY23_9GAMM|nr:MULTISPECIES: Gfo/Idh/MocA family oxidoreductase [Pantoea]KAA6098874.1 oxidoreductase [Pantoea sp. B_9]KAA6115000.1 oxidoreductase [Pantoea sp. B_10]MDT8852703.1 Gfo/Idh/MocA family oxidoreductase [Pantoea dispersa]QZY89975.1 Gfo/Idh/MocA family oxidoreductase [Pantoea dispersa]TQC74917.1 oxidoreductase [Pantoea dispersa]